MDRLKIYLSPSNQPNNKYIVGDTNEKIEMEALAEHIKEILEKEYECDVVMATKTLSINLDGRPKEAKEKGCHVYLAIHSNASSTGKAKGAICFYHWKYPDSRILALNILENLNKVCPIQSNRSTTLFNGMLAFNKKGYAEIRNPGIQNIIPILVETNFHDHAPTAKWMIENKAIIAKAYVQGIVETFNVKRKALDKDKFYKVQVGAFLNKNNAFRLLKKLKDKGFDGFIKYD